MLLPPTSVATAFFHWVCPNRKWFLECVSFVVRPFIALGSLVFACRDQASVLSGLFAGFPQEEFQWVSSSTALWDSWREFKIFTTTIVFGVSTALWNSLGCYPLK